MNVHWTEAALADAKAIEQYIARHSVIYARRMVERILDRTALLADFPHLGPVVEEYGDESLREVLEYPYRIIYRVLEKQIDVIAVVHGARRLPPNL